MLKWILGFASSFGLFIKTSASRCRVLDFRRYFPANQFAIIRERGKSSKSFTTEKISEKSLTTQDLPHSVPHRFSNKIALLLSTHHIVSCQQDDSISVMIDRSQKEKCSFSVDHFSRQIAKNKRKTFGIHKQRPQIKIF